MSLSPLLCQTEQDNQQDDADTHLHSRHGGIASGAGHGQLKYRGIHHGQLDEVFTVLLKAALVDRFRKKLIVYMRVWKRYCLVMEKHSILRNKETSIP